MYAEIILNNVLFDSSSVLYYAVLLEEQLQTIKSDINKRGVGEGCVLSGLKLCGDFLREATQQENEIDIHVTHSLTQLLPILSAGSDDDSVEDSYVHHYLGPALQSVYSTDPRFSVRWANGTLYHDSSFKPDFQVSTRCINVKCVIVVAEFKPKSHNSSVESDLVKLGKQMKTMCNDLVQKRTPQPTVCGLLCQGENVCTFIMNMPSPRVYRMTKLSAFSPCSSS
ncbi:hypothetical protein MBANPS3_004990 [Mucor bainieri]